MWRSKKFIIVAALATILLAGTIGGIVVNADDGDENAPDTLLDKVCAILQAKGYDITCEALEDAFAQAGEEMRTAALEAWLLDLVDQEKITQQQADDYLEWWGARPDMPNKFGFGDHRGMRGFGGMRGFDCPFTPAE